MANFTYENFGRNSLYEGSYTGTGIQAVIPIVYLPHGFTVQLTPTGGDAKVQASNNNVDWIDWDAGDVSATTMSYMHPVRFVRVNAGTATSCTVTLWGF